MAKKKIDHNEICTVCGHRAGDHRFADQACPVRTNPHKYTYRETKFTPQIFPDEIIESIKGQL